MTALQFTRHRKKLFRTQAAAAEAMGVTVGTISHWEIGRRPVPAIAVKLLECLERSESRRQCIVKMEDRLAEY